VSCRGKAIVRAQGTRDRGAIQFIFELRDFDADELGDEEEIDGGEDVTSDFDHGEGERDGEEKEEEEALECNRNKRPRTN
jgi:hypothetical protein